MLKSSNDNENFKNDYSQKNLKDNIFTQQNIKIKNSDPIKNLTK